MKVKLSQVIEALEMTNQETEGVLDKVTGEIVWISGIANFAMTSEEVGDVLDEHGFYRLPNAFEINEYGIMDAFVRSLPTPQSERLAEAISGKGAFRRFKDGVRQLGIEAQWYEYRASAFQQLAIDWCSDNGLECVI